MNALSEESVVRAIGSSMILQPNPDRVSIFIDMFVTPPPDTLWAVQGARLDYIESLFTPDRLVALRYRLTVIGGPVRCAVVQNLIKAATQGDEAKRQRFLCIANQ